MRIYRLSYSQLNYWQAGNYEDAIKSYMDELTFENKEMYAGKSLHKMWEHEVNQYNTIPRVFGGDQLGDVNTELKITKYVKVNDDIVICFSGVLDLWENDTKIARDWKTGKSISGAQYLFYNYLQPTMTKFIYHLFNQNTQETSIAIKHCNEASYRAGEEWGLTNAMQLIDYLQTNNIFNENRHNKSLAGYEELINNEK
jgi:hypothetical protein